MYENEIYNEVSINDISNNVKKVKNTIIEKYGKSFERFKRDILYKIENLEDEFENVYVSFSENNRTYYITLHAIIRKDKNTSPRTWRKTKKISFPHSINNNEGLHSLYNLFRDRIRSLNEIKNELKEAIRKGKESMKENNNSYNESSFSNISYLMNKLSIFEEEYNIYNEGLFNKKQPISLKEATPKLKEQIKQLKDQGYDFAHVNWIKHEEPDTYNYYKKNGLIVKIYEIYCFIKGTKEDIKSVNVYLINKQDAVIVKKLKFK